MEEAHQCVPWLGILSDVGASMVGAHQGPMALQAYDAAQPLEERLFFSGRLTNFDTLRGSIYDASEAETPSARGIQSITALAEKIVAASSALFAHSAFGVVLSGDHSSAAGVIAGIQCAHPNERLGVLWIDAHVDMHTPHTSPSGNMHGMPLGAALQLNSHQNPHLIRKQLPKNVQQSWHKLQHLSPSPLRIQDIAFVAPRSIDPAEQHVLDTEKAFIIPVKEMHEVPLSTHLKRIQAHFSNCDRVYISFDVDSLDPEVAPATGTPVAGGLRVDRAMSLIEGLLPNPKVCGFGCTELNPVRKGLSEAQCQRTIKHVWRLLRCVVQAKLA